MKKIGHLDILLTQVDMEVLFDALHARTMHLMGAERQALVGGSEAQADYYAMLAEQNQNFIEKLKLNIKALEVA